MPQQPAMSTPTPASLAAFEHAKPWLPFAVALSCLPYTLVYFLNLWKFAHYQFFPVLLIAVGWLLWQRLGGRHAGSGFEWFLRSTLLAGGAFAALCATVFASPWMGYFGFACAAGAWLASRADKGASGRSLFYLSVPLFLIWQPPYNTIMTADTVLIQQLQTFSAKLSSRWLDTFGYVHFQPGTVLEFAGKSFGVAEACSGIQSFFAVLCFAALLQVYMRRGVLHSCLLMATSPLWAILMNTIRITAIPVAYAALGIDLSHGLIHDLLGFCTMGIAIGLLISADELLLKLGELASAGLGVGSKRAVKASVTDNPDRQIPVATPHHARLTAKSVALGLAMVPLCGLFVLQCTDAVASWGIQKKTIDFFRDEPLIAMSYKDAPEVLNGWPQLQDGYHRENRERDNDDLGQQSDLWYYDSPHGRVSLSFDQMFPGWHELTRCYRSAGWTLEKRSVVPTSVADTWPAVTAEFSREGEHGFLVWSLVTRNGKPVEPPGEWNTWTSLKERLQNRLTPAVRGALFGIAAYQVQVFVTDVAPVSEQAKADALTAFLSVRDPLWAKAKARLNGAMQPGNQ